jgi:hypothetical protein
MRRPLLLGSVLCVVVAACASRPAQDVNVIGSDYAFEVADSVPSGAVVFRYRNAGKVRHEMIVIRLTEGASTRSVADAMRTDSTIRSMTEPGAAVLFADPGDSNNLGLALDLIPGRQYLLLCRFRDGKDKPPHNTLGMYKLLTAR